MTPIFVDDVASILVRTVETDVPPILNVAGDQVLSIRDMANAIGAALGISPVFEDGPGSRHWTSSPTRPCCAGRSSSES